MQCSLEFRKDFSLSGVGVHKSPFDHRVMHGEAGVRCFHTRVLVGPGGRRGASGSSHEEHEEVQTKGKRGEGKWGGGAMRRVQCPDVRKFRVPSP